MKPWLIALQAIVTVIVFAGCSGATGADDARELVLELAVGKTPSNFGGHQGDAIETLRERQRSQKGPLYVEVTKGDHPDLGDGTAEFHCHVSEAPSKSPFLGLRLKREGGKWHILGYWTPK